MNFLRVRSRMRRMRTELEEDEEIGGELNLVPYLDIVTNVVMFLLATVTFSAPLAQMTVNAPHISQDPGNPEKQRQALKLAIEVSASGFFVAGNDQRLKPGKRIPKKGDGDYDWDALRMLLGDVKKDHPKEYAVSVALDSFLPYQLLVQTFDAVRGSPEYPLFPNAALGVVQ